MRTVYQSSIMQVTQTVEFPARVTITPIPSDIPKPEDCRRVRRCL